ncbi:4Fe-4S dicluster domain-containing protein [Thermococcus gammatolerans]|nr:ferredoxin family protein [Thermococcus gammatolerans]
MSSDMSNTDMHGGLMEAEDWRVYHERMKETAPLTIHYPLCGGGEECISACPFGEEIWEVVPMRVSLFGLGYKVRLRPYMAHPEKCRKCYICVEACPTGALTPVDRPVRHPAFVFIYNALKLPFKKRYGVKFVFRREHVEKFKRNNWPKG